MKYSVLVGLIDVASNTHDIGLAFKKQGYDVTTVIISRNRFYQNLKYDIIFDDFNPLKHIAKIRYIIRVILTSFFFLLNFWKYDYIIYNGALTFIPFRIDQLILKLLNRKFAILFSGSEIRYRPIHIEIEEKRFKYIRYIDKNKELFLKDSTFFDFLQKLYITKYTNFLTKNIFSSRSISTFMIKPFYKIFKPLFISEIEIKKNNIITIVHAPSNSIIKNTQFFLECLEELKLEGYIFNLELIQNKSNNDVLRKLASAHIAIDQFAALPGRFAQEAMFLGCVVLGGNKHYYEQKCDEIPVIDIILDKQNFKNKVIDLINNPDKIRYLGKLGKEYIYKYHNKDRVVDDLILAMNNMAKPNLEPICKNKDELLKYCSNWYEILFIKLFL